MLEQKPAERAALAAALTEVIRQLDVPDAVVCIRTRVAPDGEISPEGRRADPGPRLRGAVRASRPVVAPSDCPETYGGQWGILMDDGSVRYPEPPSGHVDPYRIDVWQARSDLPRAAWFAIQASRGAWTDFYECDVVPQDDGWRADCRHTDSAISRAAPTADEPGSVAAPTIAS